MVLEVKKQNKTKTKQNKKIPKIGRRTEEFKRVEKTEFTTKSYSHFELWHWILKYKFSYLPSTRTSKPVNKKGKKGKKKRKKEKGKRKKKTMRNFQNNGQNHLGPQDLPNLQDTAHSYHSKKPVIQNQKVPLILTSCRGDTQIPMTKYHLFVYFHGRLDPLCWMLHYFGQQRR